MRARQEVSTTRGAGLHGDQKEGPRRAKRPSSSWRMSGRVPPMQKAVDKIRAASDLDNSVTASGSSDPGRYDGAIALYMGALSLFQHVLRRASKLPTASSHPVQVDARGTTRWTLRSRHLVC